MKKFVFIFLSIFFFLGCQGSSKNDIENSHQLNPKILISDINLTSNVLTGKLKLIETDNFYSDVIFDKIKINNDKCEINNLNLDKNILKNGETVNFEANVSCSYIDNLNVSFEEKAHYLDTSLKTLKQVENKEYFVNVGNKNAKKLGTVTVQPSTATINTGDSYTFTVYTFDANNNPVSVPVKIDPPISGGKIIGEFDKYSLTTDTNGKGEFKYIAPATISSNSISFNVTVTINNNIKKNINITVQKKKEIIINPTKLLLVPNKIVLANGASQKITIFTLDSDNRGVSTTVILPQPIDNDNESWGTFDKYKLVTNENGEATVTFTATNDVQGLKETNLSVPIEIQSTGLEQNLSLEKPKLETNNTFYKIDYNVPNSVAVNTKFNLIIKVLNSENNESIDSNDVNKLVLTSENHLIYFDNNTSEFSKTFNKLNPISLQAKSFTVSGIDIIDVNASVKKENILISAQIPIVVVSGPASAISINLVGGNYNSDTGLFEKIYSIHAVDKYSNPVQAGTKIKVGAIINAKKVSNKGELLANSDNFKDITQTFDNDLINNSLIIFADSTHTDPSYLGGWIIKNIVDSHTLKLTSIFSADTNISNLSYVIGNEKRYVECEKTLAVADFDSKDKTYTVDNQGNTKVILKFDPYLAGKTISLYANSFKNKRVGDSLKDVLLSELLFKEIKTNEDDNAPHTDDLWEKTSGKNTTRAGVIYIGMKGGPYTTVVGDGTTLLKNVPVTIKVLTSSVCKFDNGSVIQKINTDCNGGVNFSVDYDENGTCKVKFVGVNYEY